MFAAGRRARAALLVAAACAAPAAAGCGGAAPGGPDTQLIVTRDFGTEVVTQRESVASGRGLTVMRQLARTHKLATAYGGRYVESIDGFKESAQRSWLFYVDGIESQSGATARRLTPRQVVQWDFHPWQAVRTGGAIVGAYPAPLRSGGARLICAPDGATACVAARRGLARSGVTLSTRARARVIVGAYRQIRQVDGVPDLTTPGSTNGAFARFTADGRRLTPVTGDGRDLPAHAAGTGLLAAFARAGRVTWLVTGTDDAGTAAAAELLGGGGPKLRNLFAVLVEGGGASTPLPRPESP